MLLRVVHAPFKTKTVIWLVADAEAVNALLIACDDALIRKCRRFSDKKYIIVKVREVISMIEQDGWYLVRTKGDHRQFKHPVKQGRVTIS